MIAERNGGRDWDRTSDPCDVNARGEKEVSASQGHTIPTAQ